MAGAPKIKITAEDIAKTEKEIKSAAEISGTKAVAEALNKPIKAVEDILRKGLSTRAGQQIIKTVDNLDKKLLDLRAPKQTTPPSVPSEFAKEQIKPPGETGFQITGPTGGPLVPTTQTRNLPDTTAITPEVVSPRMQNVSQKLLTPGVQDAERVSTGLVPGGQARPIEVPQDELARLASNAKRGTPGQVVTERMPRNRPSLSDEFDARMGFDEVTGAPKSVVPKKAAGLGAAAAAAGAAGLASVGFSKVANAPVVVTEADVDKPDDVVRLLEKAKENVEPDKQAALVQQAQQLQAAAQSIEDKLTKDYEKKQARVELMKLTETIMHGLVTAIGANALLNRNSPFAVDFSQGPKTDWNSQFDRLQKDYATQMGLITQKYKLEASEKKAEAAEAGREARFQQELSFKREELGIKQQKAATEAAKKTSERDAANKDKAFAELSGAIAALKEKSTPISAKQVTASATRLGIPPGKIDLLISKTTGKGAFNLADEKEVAKILEEYRPGQAAPAAAAPTSDLEAKKKRMQELLAKQKGG